MARVTSADNTMGRTEQSDAMIKEAGLKKIVATFAKRAAAAGNGAAF